METLGPGPNPLKKNAMKLVMSIEQKYLLTSAGVLNLQFQSLDVSNGTFNLLM